MISLSNHAAGLRPGGGFLIRGLCIHELSRGSCLHETLDSITKSQVSYKPSCVSLLMGKKYLDMLVRFEKKDFFNRFDNFA